MSTPPGTCPRSAPFACQTPADSCGGNADCNGTGSTRGGLAVCDYTQSRHQCVQSCVFGRPFLVHGSARTAETQERSDWQGGVLEARVDRLYPEQRETLAREWARMGAMEHASIAAFARFALQLLSVGAPASLLEQTHEAMRDETRHARMCFALASRYAGRAVGPGALPVGGALSDLDAGAILKTTILEGCIGETIAAVEAEEALAHAQDPAVRAVLSQIAAEEKRHAELAWHYVLWATSNDDALRATAIRVFGSELAAAQQARAPATERDEGLLAFGIVSDGLRREIRARVLRDVVALCARVLLVGPASGGTTKVDDRTRVAC